jgi:hypothetical protein
VDFPLCSECSAQVARNALKVKIGRIIRAAMTTYESGEANLQRQIDDLKKRIDEMQDVLIDLIAQLKARGLYRAPG